MTDGLKSYLIFIADIIIFFGMVCLIRYIFSIFQLEIAFVDTSLACCIGIVVKRFGAITSVLEYNND